MPETSATQAARDNPKQLFQPKWDWPLAFALFIGGMGFHDLMKLPQFQGINEKMLRNRAAKEEWIRKRREAAAEMGTTLAKNLSERLAEAADVHQEFMRTRLEKERNVLQNEVIKGGLGEQQNRLKNLQMIDDMARKLTGLDDRKPLDPGRLNLSITVALAAGHQPQKKLTGRAISGSANAILVSVETPQTGIAATIPAGALSEAVSILRAKEAGTLETYAKSEPTIDLEVDEIDRTGFKPVAPLKLGDDEPKEGVLVNESPEPELTEAEADELGMRKDLVEILREEGYDAHDMTADEVKEAIKQASGTDTENPSASEDTEGSETNESYTGPDTQPEDLDAGDDAAD